MLLLLPLLLVVVVVLLLLLLFPLVLLLICAQSVESDIRYAVDLLGGQAQSGIKPPEVSDICLS